MFGRQLPLITNFLLNSNRMANECVGSFNSLPSGTTNLKFNMFPFLNILKDISE